MFSYLRCFISGSPLSKSNHDIFAWYFAKQLQQWFPSYEMLLYLCESWGYSQTCLGASPTSTPHHSFPSSLCLTWPCTFSLLPPSSCTLLAQWFLYCHMYQLQWNTFFAHSSARLFLCISTSHRLVQNVHDSTLSPYARGTFWHHFIVPTAAHHKSPLWSSSPFPSSRKPMSLLARPSSALVLWGCLL